MDFHDFEHDGWERAADHYGDAFGSLTSQTIPALLRAAAVEPNMRVLDVASGPGYVAAEAAALGAHPVGVDFATEMVTLASRRYPSLTFKQGDAEALPFADASFDAVAINFGVLHLARPDTALAEAHRVLRPGGRCAFTVWASPDLSVGFGIVLKAIETHGRMDVPLPPGPPFFRFSDAGESSRSMSAVGFAAPDVKMVPLVWRLRSGEALCDAFLQGAVRTAALLRAQTPEAMAKIRHAIVERAEKYQKGDHIELPMAAVLTSGSRP
ncbi:MAG TPA: methyltransferase domain-containing protein [Vicinamibacterales bacterium]|jgi:SAM-dependent methyltransferase|nr:methyltransferase domain-containing protein [Vicinamibacterales bacterium]